MSGVGKGLLYGLIEIGGQLELNLIWGEATANSVRKSRKPLMRAVDFAKTTTRRRARKRIKL